MANPLFDTLFGKHIGNEAVFLHTADGKTLTYAAFLRMTAQFTGQLTQLGLTAGDRVAVQITKSPQALAIYAACAQAGVIFLPLNAAYMPDEVRYFVQNSGARVVLCDPSKAEALRPIAIACTAALETMDADGNGTFRQTRCCEIQPDFKLDAVLENLPRATTMMGVPTFYTRLLGDDRFTQQLKQTPVGSNDRTNHGRTQS
jgi:acyl-CoA synthetase (AMP-forming)/AMP-acid ligase II